jgi:hypothetical protein
LNLGLNYKITPVPVVGELAIAGLLAGEFIAQPDWRPIRTGGLIPPSGALILDNRLARSAQELSGIEHLVNRHGRSERRQRATQEALGT